MKNLFFFEPTIYKNIEKKFDYWNSTIIWNNQVLEQADADDVEENSKRFPSNEKCFKPHYSYEGIQFIVLLNYSKQKADINWNIFYITYKM